MQNKTSIQALVFSQFLWMGLILFFGGIYPNNIYLLLVEAAGAFLGFYSIYIMKIGNFNVAPIPKEGGEMRVNGPYKYIRHPMYVAALITFITLVIEDFTYLKLGFWIALFITFVLKMNIEEEKLKAHFSGYNDYCKDSWRFVPFIY